VNISHFKTSQHYDYKESIVIVKNLCWDILKTCKVTVLVTPSEGLYNSLYSNVSVTLQLIDNSTYEQGQHLVSMQHM